MCDQCWEDVANEEAAWEVEDNFGLVPPAESIQYRGQRTANLHERLDLKYCVDCYADHYPSYHVEIPEEVADEAPVEPSFISVSALHLADTLRIKNTDYRVDGEFSNFQQAGEFAGLTPIDVMLVQIGIKLTRIKGLMASGAQPETEPLKDSFLDLAGYAIIAHAYMESLNVDPR